MEDSAPYYASKGDRCKPDAAKIKPLVVTVNKNGRDTESVLMIGKRAWKVRVVEPED